LLKVRIFIKKQEQGGVLDQNSVKYLAKEF